MTENKSKINLDDIEQEPKVSSKPPKSSSEKKPKSEIDTQKLIKQHQDEVEKLKHELLSALAENQNLRKRFAKEKEDITKFAISSALSELSSPFENLFTALKIELSEDLKENNFVKSIIEGVLMVQKDFEKVFNKLGLVRIYPEGEKFDPNLHQAVAQIESQEVNSGFVVNVVSAGFQLNGRVLKPAMVVVAK